MMRPTERTLPGPVEPPLRKPRAVLLRDWASWPCLGLLGAVVV